MSDVHELLDKTINPPGIQKKNRGSIFKTIGDVGAKIKEDALKAFNAHFPYLADEKKLEEHGTALLIPHLLHDGKEEFRNRVAAASFFLSKAGERGYILSQLEAHFGGRYILSEEFLKVYVKVLDLTDQEQLWVQRFLDELLNPVITLTVGHWYAFLEKLSLKDDDAKSIRRFDNDLFTHNRVFRNGYITRQGKHPSIATLVLRNSGITDRLTLSSSITAVFETWQTSLSATSTQSITDICTIGIRYHYFRNGQRLRNGTVKRTGGILIDA